MITSAQVVQNLPGSWMYCLEYPDIYMSILILNVPSTITLFLAISIIVHFCGNTSNNELGKIHERSLRILYHDYNSY